VNVATECKRRRMSTRAQTRSPRAMLLIAGERACGGAQKAYAANALCWRGAVAATRREEVARVSTRVRQRFMFSKAGVSRMARLPLREGVARGRER